MASQIITEEELERYRHAAERAWADDTRHWLYRGDPIPSSGQCYVTSRWLVSHLGGFVGSKSGHYFWVSPEGTDVIDLTGDQFCTGQPTLASANESAYRGFRVVRDSGNARAERFIRRANLELRRKEDDIYKVATDYAGDAYPGEMPQAQEDHDQRIPNNPYWHDEPSDPAGSGEYQFVYANGQLHVSPMHSHDELAEHAQIDGDYSGPIAVGYVNVVDSKAKWDVHSNVSLHALQQVLRDYGESVGWQWGGLADIEGDPIGGDDPKLSPAKSSVLPFRFIGSHLYIGSEGSRDLDLIEGWLRKQAKAQDLRRYAAKWLPLSLAGTVQVDDYYAVLQMSSLGPAFKYAGKDEIHDRFGSFLEAISEWTADRGLSLHIAGNDNIIKPLEFDDQHNLADPDPKDLDAHQYFPAQKDDTEVSEGIYRCPACSRLFPSYFELEKHQTEESKLPDEEPHPNADIAQNDADEPVPKHFQEMNTPGLSPISHTFTIPDQPVAEVERVDGFETYAKLRDLEDDELTHYVAYQDGSPVGWASLRDNEIVMMHEARSGVNDQIMALLQRQHDELLAEPSTDELECCLKQSGWAQASAAYWKWAQGQDPSQALTDSIPFIYDVQEDSIFIGEPGQRASDIHGHFNPGGIVEGTYEPGGKVAIRAMTDIPYTVRHLLELWYFQHPELEIKSVSMLDDAGGESKLAKSVGHHVLARIASNAAAFRASRALSSLGEVYAVGPIVRNTALDIESPEIPRLIVIGEHLVPEAAVNTLKGLPGEVETTDDGWLYKQAYSQVLVEYPLPSITAALESRDFTANAIAVNTRQAELVDPVNGIADIEAGLLQPLSLGWDWQLRAIRMAGLGLMASEDLSKVARAQATVYPTDILGEVLEGLIASENPSQGIRVAHDLGVLNRMLPEVEGVWNYEQDARGHALPLGEHLLRTLDIISHRTKDPDLRLAALLHDIGKPHSRWTDEAGRGHYYRSKTDEGDNHEEVGARMARGRLYELGFSEDRIDRIARLINLHMWQFSTLKSAKRFVRNNDVDADDLLQLRYADMSSKGREPDLAKLTKQRELVREARRNV